MHNHPFSFSWSCSLHTLLAVGTLVGAAPRAAAELLPNRLFSDHAVLQQDAAVPVWGTAAPGENVTVSFQDQTRHTVADKSGEWMVKLDPLREGTTGTLTMAGTNTVVASDVLVGEVWLCSGQSNMAWKVARVRNAEAEIAAANDPRIRMFLVETNYQHEPQKACRGKWIVCSPQTAGSFSAAAYFFGRELNKELGRPIGLVVSSVGGTTIQTWSSQEALGALPEFPAFKEQAERAKAELAAQSTDLTTSQDRRMRREALVAKKNAFLLGGLFNGMINPLVPYAIRGAIWYQGEANSRRFQERYDEFLEALISDWRGRWQMDFPFAWVQLPEYRDPQKDPGKDEDWAAMRESMRNALRIPHTGMAVTLGLGQASELHPPDKQEVGRRLALWALNEIYGRKEFPASGPLPAHHEIKDGRIVVTFTHADGGLVAKNGKLEGFAICGEDRKWEWADADIAGNTITASSPKVPNPVALRYAWADNPKFSLYNAMGLPASPFRTDDFPIHPSSSPPSRADAEE